MLSACNCTKNVQGSVDNHMCSFACAAQYRLKVICQVNVNIFC